MVPAVSEQTVSREMRAEYNWLFGIHATAARQRIDWIERLTDQLMKDMVEWAKEEKPLYKPEARNAQTPSD